MPTVEAGGVQLHYEITGVAGPPVLLIHGLGSSTRDWERQLPVFSATHRLIAVDLRGHGRSDKPPGLYSIKGFADDVALLLDELGSGPVSVIGLSLGAMVGFQLAADHPDLVRSLMAVNAVPVFDSSSLGMRLQVALRRVITRLAPMHKIGEILAGRLFPDDELAEERATMIERWAENDKTAYRASFRAILAWPGVVDEMSRFDKPIVIVASDQDYTPVRGKQPHVDAMPTAELVVIENAHHAVPVERPDQFNEVMGRFLAR